MNIKFHDEALAVKLREASLVTCLVGSRSYGMTHQYSDFDFLYVYPTPDAELYSVFQSHHQLQYKDKEGNDHLFVSLRSFLANLVNGDSVLNFEALFTPEMRWSLLEPLVRSKYMFYSQKLIRSYLGKARKDHKEYLRLAPGETKKRLKKLGHLIRSYYFAEHIKDQNFDLQSGIIKAYISKVSECTAERQDFYANQMLLQVNYLREIVDNNKLYIASVMDVRHQDFIDNLVRTDLMETDEYKCKKGLLKDFSMKLFYEANETGLVYNA